MSKHLLIYQDCIEFLKNVPSNSIDLVLTDPPYNIEYGKEEWDCFKSEADYLSWCSKWTSECVRVLKPNRMLTVFGTLKTDTFLKYRAQTLDQNSELFAQNEIIWSYNWGGRSKTNFARKHEYIWCFSKGDSFYFDADAVRVERKQKTNIRTGLLYENGTIPTCVWEQNNHTMSKEFVKWHPTQKPLVLLERAITGYSPLGGTVLDCFSGSGSVSIACEKTGRLFTGCDNNAEYVTKSVERFKSYFSL